MSKPAQQGYIYQDILGAYLIAREIANGREGTRIQFDEKKTGADAPDKFDDLAIFKGGGATFIQVKYSNAVQNHTLTKDDFARSGKYDLALFDLFASWSALKRTGAAFRILLAWNCPAPNDPILDVLLPLPNGHNLLPGTICYRFEAEKLWPESSGVLPSWKALKKRSTSIDRQAFREFLDALVIEVECPKSSLLEHYEDGLEWHLEGEINRIGVGVYPNDHLSMKQVAIELADVAMRQRCTDTPNPISCTDVALHVGIKLSYGGIEQIFPIDETLLVSTPERVEPVVQALETHRRIVLTAEPGAGKSWFLENLQRHVEETTNVVTHYCFVALDDPLSNERITVNVLYGSLITQLLAQDDDLQQYSYQRYASNLEALNALLQRVELKTILIVDGIDHIWRVYQKNGGGLAPEEITILNALAQIDVSNPNISLLAVSQPIEALSALKGFYACTLAPISPQFVIDLMEKKGVSEIDDDDDSLSNHIHQKSNGNALYCKYLIDHAKLSASVASLEWLHALPPYDFNLTGYYRYIFNGLEGDSQVPNALCGAGFSLTEHELKEITGLGDLVRPKLETLKPILRFSPTYGYAIYHESVRRFLTDRLKEQNVCIERVVYGPLISWLGKHDFFKSTKAYSHLLKLYYEVDDLPKIATTIVEDFVEKSLFHAQPLHSIKQNHALQVAAIGATQGFEPLILLSEQLKVIEGFEYWDEEVYPKYLRAIRAVHGSDEMYRVLWDGERLFIPRTQALHFLRHDALRGREEVHWDIVSRSPNGIVFEEFGPRIIQCLHQEEYDAFEAFVDQVSSDPRYTAYWNVLKNEAEWWTIFHGDDWINSTPAFKTACDLFDPSTASLDEVARRVVEHGVLIADDWQQRVNDVIAWAKIAGDQDIQNTISHLHGHNWYHNWIIFLIQVEALKRRAYRDEDVIDAFSYLVRDLDPFKGSPRVCDVNRDQGETMRLSFHRGLALCRGDETLVRKCIDLLERVTGTTTSIQRSFSGPLTDEAYLDLVSVYLPIEVAIKRVGSYYESLKARRLYGHIAEVEFEFAALLSNAGRESEALAKYQDGVRSLGAYVFRRDRTLSEILDSSGPFQKQYGSLDKTWFYDLYRMALSVVQHTDGKDTKWYPIEWFGEVVEVFPDGALRVLASNTIENDQAQWYEEDQFKELLEEWGALFTPTDWFLLCRSMPLAASEKILDYGMTVIEQIDEDLRGSFQRWLQALPKVSGEEDRKAYSPDVALRFKEVFDIELPVKEVESNKSHNRDGANESEALPTTSLEATVTFLKKYRFEESHVGGLLALLQGLEDRAEKSELLRKAAFSLKFESSLGDWVERLFTKGSWEWRYWSVCLFVYKYDGWYHPLSHTKYFHSAFEDDPEVALALLKEILGHYLHDGGSISLLSCNLIRILSELGITESEVRPLLDLTMRSVRRRLPHPATFDSERSALSHLEEFDRGELVVALLIARLTTLTVEKTQGIIWSLTYVARTSPQRLLRPIKWAFEHKSQLLPIHRAFLLQVLLENIEVEAIPDEIVATIFESHPTGYYLEDQFIQALVGSHLDIKDEIVSSIYLEADARDTWLLPYCHPKYAQLASRIGTLTGTYKAYAHRRDAIGQKYRDYQLDIDKLMTPIAAHSNAAYDIINRQFYRQLKDLTEGASRDDRADMEFWLDEITLQVGSIGPRPLGLPLPSTFSGLLEEPVEALIKDREWIILSHWEEEIVGERWKDKTFLRVSRMLCPMASGNEEIDCSSRYMFRARIFSLSLIDKAPWDSIICQGFIRDYFEHLRIEFVAPWIVRDLGLHLDQNFPGGLRALDEGTNTIIQMVTWREDYYGEIRDGTEVPRLSGVAVLIKQTWLERLLALLEGECRIVTTIETIPGPAFSH